MTGTVEATGLTRAFDGGLAVDDLTFDVQPGEVLALLGPNGAGKTTTVRLLNGVLAPDSGHTRVLGLDPATHGDAVRHRTGVLTENAGLDERLTARENLSYSARLRGMSRIDADRKAGELLDRFDMGERADQLVQGASTGQRKRVALARALLHDPEVLFLDEPTSGLDPSATRDVVDLIRRLAEEGRTIILCTHFLGEAGDLAHRMAVLHRGRLQAFGTPAALAGELWTGMELDLELSTRVDDSAVQALTAQHGVIEVNRTKDGLRLRVHDRAVIPTVVEALVHRQIPVFAAVPRPPSLEDVYFEIENRINAGDVR